MKWKNLGRIFNPLNYSRHNQLQTHASNPTVYKINSEKVRVFYSGRDKKNRSSLGAFDFCLKNKKITNNYFDPLFRFGPKNSFHQDGVSVSSVIKIENQIYLYFMGWQSSKNSHWRGDIGRVKLCINSNKISNPQLVIGKNNIDKISVSYPFVKKLNDGFYHIWYGSTITWDAGNGEMHHVINHGTSEDGLNWKLNGQVIPSKIGVAQAFSRPCLFKDKNNKLHIWFSYRSGDGSSYKIGYGYKEEGEQNWNINYKINNFDFIKSNWNSQMMEYPYVINYKNKLFLFYNGNQYGMTGIGLAVTEDV